MPKEITCPICGQLFNIPPTRPNQKYCCRECSVIGRRLTKEDTARERVDNFIESLRDLPIVDVLEGRFNPGTTDNRVYITAKGAATWPDKKFIVVVVDDL